MRNFSLAALVILVVGCSTAPAGAPPVSASARAAQDAATKAPTCAVSMSAPRAIEGANFFGSGTLADCTETDWDGVLQVRFAQGGFLAGLNVDRAQASSGDTLDLGVQATAFTNDYAPCEGTVTWTADEPDWALSVNAVCHGAAGDYDLVASVHGHVYEGNQ